MPIHDWTRVPAGIFHDFHLTWIIEIKRALNDGALPTGYHALAEQISGDYEPDELRRVRWVTIEPLRGKYEEDRYATKTKSLVIRHNLDDHVVAVIEFVSPGHKSGRHAFRSFVEHSVRLIRSGVHLLVVDLFPPGPRDWKGIHHAIWSEFDHDDDFEQPDLFPLSLASYAAGDVVRAFVEPVAVGMPLQSMPLFLEPDHYVEVPLESTYLSSFAVEPDRWHEVLEARETD